jgi:hypothetical protein
MAKTIAGEAASAGVVLFYLPASVILLNAVEDIGCFAGFGGDDLCGEGSVTVEAWVLAVRLGV